jgi:opacity protein-like surface antigen
MIRTFALLIVCALTSLAQPIGIGLKGGIPLNGTFGDVGNFTSDTKRYIVGPMVELRLPAGFAIEGDALYTRVNLSGPLSAAGSIFGSVLNTNSWEFPVLVKKKFGGANAIAASARPYVGAGASFRYLSGLGSIPSFITSGRDVDKNNTGFVVGAGVEIRALVLHISPEFRFTRWGTDNFASGLANIWKTNQNQGQFLIGISF